MSLEVYSRQSKAFQYDGYKINSEMREKAVQMYIKTEIP